MSKKLSKVKKWQVLITLFWLKIPVTSELMVSRMILIIHDGNSKNFSKVLVYTNLIISQVKVSNMA